jgi:hypothetical protein
MSLPSEKRAVAIGMVSCFSSISSFYKIYLWPKLDALRYLTDFITVSTFMGVGVLLDSTIPLMFLRLPRSLTKAEREIVQLEIHKEEEEEEEED